MKKNTGLWLAFGAGLAVAGATAIFLNSQRGKSAKRKIREKGENLIHEAEEILTETKDKFDNLKTEWSSGLFKNNRKKTEAPEDIVM